MKHQILPLAVTAPFMGTVQTVCPTLLIDAENRILVDCGFIGSLPILEQELARYGLSPSRLTGLVLTHHDHDHMGAAAALKRANPSLTIYASPTEAPYISAQEKPLRLRQAEALQATLPAEQQAFGQAFCDLLRRVEPVFVDQLLCDGDDTRWCGSCRIVATPGHTPGYISLVIASGSVVITGDAMALENGRPVLANPAFTFDPQQAAKSMERLLSLGADAYFCYHGGVYRPQPQVVG